MSLHLQVTCRSRQRIPRAGEVLNHFRNSSTFPEAASEEGLLMVDAIRDLIEAQAARRSAKATCK